jgi:hypothetical protein
MGGCPTVRPKRFSPEASTLIYGREDAVLTDPPLTTEQARLLGDWVAAKGRNLTDIFVTHGHGDHWFSAGLLAERFGARVVASPGTIAQMHANVAQRPFLWDKVYTGLIPDTPVTAVPVPDNRFALEGHELVIVDVGSTDSADTSVLHVPDLGLVIAGDVIYNGVHMYLAQRASSEASGRGATRSTRSRPSSPGTSSPVTRTRSSTTTPTADRGDRQYLDDADELLLTAKTAVDFFDAKLERYPDHLGRTVLWAGSARSTARASTRRGRTQVRPLRMALISPATRRTGRGRAGRR